MIPTRMHQSFNQGLVAGFNKRTGSVIVVSENHYRIDEFDLNTIESEIKKTELSLPGYTWPSITDIETVASEYTTILEFFNSIQVINTCLVSKTVITSLNGELEMSQLFLYKSNRQIKTLRRYYGSSVCYGNLTPVLLINGENCDTY